ncbi:MAG: Hpt domain-containing protein [Bacteroidota bacterium]
METTRVSDLGFLKQFSSGNTAMMKQLINVFLQTSQDAMSKIEGFIAEKNWERVGAIAHQLKPQCSYMGIKTAEQLILKIEELKNSADGGNIPELFSQLKTMLETAVVELKEELTKIS